MDKNSRRHDRRARQETQLQQHELADIRERILAADLPIREHKAEIVAGLERTLDTDGGVYVLAADPGTGKTTHSPGFLLEAIARHNANPETTEPIPQKVLVLEHTRDAANNAAATTRALHAEQGVKVNNFTSEAVASHNDAHVHVMTPAILLRRLLAGNISKESVGAIMIDEVHHYIDDMTTVLIMGVLEQMPPEQRPAILCTSATLQAETVQEFFGEERSSVKRVEGVARPESETIYTQDSRPLINSWDKRKTLALPRAEAAIKDALRTTQEGNILVFLPGKYEIDRLQEAFAHDERVEVHRLHGGMQWQDRKNALYASPKEGIRKLILSTNVAESSVTPDGVSVVVDSGLEKVKVYDHKRDEEKLETRTISKDQAIQRAGRAGRTGQEHTKVYRLMNEADFEASPQHPESVVRRESLEHAALQMLAAGIKPTDFKWVYQEPEEGSVTKATLHLQKLGAIDEYTQVTDIGREMMQIPSLEPRVARFLLEANRLGGEEMLLAATAISAATRDHRLIQNSDKLRHLYKTPEGMPLGSDMEIILRVIADVMHNGTGRGFSEWAQSHGLHSGALRHVMHKIFNVHSRELGVDFNRVGREHGLERALSPEGTDTIARSLLASVPDQLFFHRYGGLQREGDSNFLSGWSVGKASACNLPTGYAVALQLSVGNNAEFLHPVHARIVAEQFPHLVEARIAGGVDVDFDRGVIGEKIDFYRSVPGGFIGASTVIDSSIEANPRLTDEERTRALAKAITSSFDRFSFHRQNRKAISVLNEYAYRTNGFVPEPPQHMQTLYEQRLTELGISTVQQLEQSDPSALMFFPRSQWQELLQQADAYFPREVSMQSGSEQVPAQLVYAGSGEQFSVTAKSTVTVQQARTLEPIQLTVGAPGQEYSVGYEITIPGVTILRVSSIEELQAQIDEAEQRELRRRHEQLQRTVAEIRRRVGTVHMMLKAYLDEGDHPILEAADAFIAAYQESGEYSDPVILNQALHTAVGVEQDLGTLITTLQRRKDAAERHERAAADRQMRTQRAERLDQHKERVRRQTIADARLIHENSGLFSGQDYQGDRFLSEAIERLPSLEDIEQMDTESVRRLNVNTIIPLERYIAEIQTRNGGTIEGTPQKRSEAMRVMQAAIDGMDIYQQQFPMHKKIIRRFTRYREQFTRYQQELAEGAPLQNMWHFIDEGSQLVQAQLESKTEQVGWHKNWYDRYTRTLKGIDSILESFNNMWELEGADALTEIPEGARQKLLEKAQDPQLEDWLFSDWVIDDLVNDVLPKFVNV